MTKSVGQARKRAAISSASSVHCGLFPSAFGKTPRGKRSSLARVLEQPEVVPAAAASSSAMQTESSSLSTFGSSREGTSELPRQEPHVASQQLAPEPEGRT
jgi:hypothetical protein